MFVICCSLLLFLRSCFCFVLFCLIPGSIFLWWCQDSRLFVMPFIISNYLHMLVIVGFQTKFPVCEWEVGSLYTNKRFSDTSCMSNALILTLSTQRSHQSSQVKDSVPQDHAPHFPLPRSAPIQVTTCTSSWQVIDGRLQQLPLRVCLIC